MTQEEDTRGGGLAPALGSARIATLADGVFVLTLLVLDLHATPAWLSTSVALVCFALIPFLYVKPARQTRHLTSLQRMSPRK